ncbi:MAG TPA: hypothetical protein VNG31_02950 [Candidatus Baltobacteraceae bacterium]|nr:hypothetical protein [Candidatus Baltobacteraceae bacterium]
MRSRVVALTILTLLSTAVPAFAQTVPALPPAIQGTVLDVIRSLAGQAVAPYGVNPNEVRGVVTFFKRFDLQVRMPLNRYRDIRLHQGTIIDPRGTTLANGDVVDVRGHAGSGGALDADVITLVRQ